MVKGPKVNSLYGKEISAVIGQVKFSYNALNIYTTTVACEHIDLK